ncbi:hypothetical protein [Rhodococcus sp. NPDC058521]|uniref:hypothetical protein n=1 Tax=Rhodococcus sp. NPDC058521 TaxID=3346536 RepID=UPI003653023F
MTLEKSTPSQSDAVHDRPESHGVDFHAEGADYLEKRTLRKGSAGWMLLAGGFATGTAILIEYAIALVGFVVFAVSAVGLFDVGNLFDIASTDAAGASSFLPFGLMGIWAAVVATFLVDPIAALWTSIAFCGFMVYFAVYSRHHLVANSPDEEFAVLAEAEEELE